MARSTPMATRLADRARHLLGRRTNRERNRELSALGLLHIGTATYEHPRVRITPVPEAPRPQRPVVSIGSYCSIGPEVEILVHGHRTDWVTTFPLRIRGGLDATGSDGSRTTEPVSVGSDVWIGMRSIILPGVTVGHGAVIAAGSVVSRDVRPYAVVAGVPAREVRRRFPDDLVDRLVAVAWWEWPPAEVREAVDRLSTDDVEGFLAWAESQPG